MLVDFLLQLLDVNVSCFCSSTARWKSECSAILHTSIMSPHWWHCIVSTGLSVEWFTMVSSEGSSCERLTESVTCPATFIHFTFVPPCSSFIDTSPLSHQHPLLCLPSSLPVRDCLKQELFLVTASLHCTKHESSSERQPSSWLSRERQAVSSRQEGIVTHMSSRPEVMFLWVSNRGWTSLDRQDVFLDFRT